MKRWLYLVHRWLGIGLCVVMAAWFLSGIVMLYVGYPKLTPDERLQGLPPLPAAGCCVPLDQALRAAGLAPSDKSAEKSAGKAPGAAATWRLSSVAGQPRYLFTDGPKVAVAVDALSGTRIASVAAEDALAAARHFAGGVSGVHLGAVQEDAWTHSRALDVHRPLHRIGVDDAEGRWLYVSSRTGEVVRDATLTERTWGWLGAWLHWLYMFRGGAVDAWWHDIVVWLAVAGTVSAVTGLVVGVWRWRFRGTYKGGAHTPYRTFMARWHHVLGMVGGLLALTWVLSGLLSVNPWKVFDAPGPKPDRQAFAGGPLLPGQAMPAATALQRLQAQGHAARELEWRRIGGVHHVQAAGAGGPWLLGERDLLADGLPTDQWLPAAAAMLPRARIVEQTLVTRYDSYYYGREPHTMTGQRERPLPVWRLRFDDPNETWVTVDPRTGSIVHVTDGHRRVDRWLFAFLHSFDLPVLLQSRPVWDAWMIGFSLAGLGLSLTAVVTGWRRLARPRRRPAAAEPRTSMALH